MGLALAVTGCAGSGEGTSPADGVDAGFVAKALSACASAQESKDGWSKFPAPDFDPTKPDAKRLPEVGAWLESEVAPTFDAWLDDLTALERPPAAREAWNAVLILVEKIDQLNRVQIQAAKDGDTDAFAEATSALQDVQPKLEEATEAAGVGKCAEVHAG